MSESTTEDFQEDPLEEVDESTIVPADDQDFLDWDSSQQGSMADAADDDEPETEEA